MTEIASAAEPAWSTVQRAAAIGDPIIALDETWPELWRLRWKASVLNGRKQTAFTIEETAPGQFHVAYGYWVIAGPADYATTLGTLGGFLVSFHLAGLGISENISKWIIGAYEEHTP
ncbi:hypothetical protein SAMN04244553_3610 [Nocardia amikacinitolerans]|uniref:Uncharacterized protein n=1 Tax=Nocardia amikacinitolerans TaxID=756689 RepID=A0A285LJJ9_9NOCA|nr:hypothetical protein [Nocardia amikacinitolerans]SNY84227.1 hypothetical protein SAMN04244553_3610 [Nocardia amikacinitolerans]